VCNIELSTSDIKIVATNTIFNKEIRPFATKISLSIPKIFIKLSRKRATNIISRLKETFSDE
jgi:hypothetical protein